mgnify:FL=1
MIRTPLKAGLAAVLAALSAGAAAAPFAYVPNEKSASVTVIDTATDTVTATLPGGKRPRGIATDGKQLFISEAPSNGLAVIDIARARETKRIRLGESPEGVSISADGKLIAAAVEESNSVAILDTKKIGRAHV